MTGKFGRDARSKYVRMRVYVPCVTKSHTKLHAATKKKHSTTVVRLKLYTIASIWCHKYYGISRGGPGNLACRISGWGGSKECTNKTHAVRTKCAKKASMSNKSRPDHKDRATKAASISDTRWTLLCMTFGDYQLRLTSRHYASELHKNVCPCDDGDSLTP